MADTINLELVTPEKRMVSAEVAELVARGAEGQFGILPGHANYITMLQPGELSCTVDGERKLFSVAGGFAEVTLDSGIRIMADAAEFAEEIDVERAKAARERAERRLRDYEAEKQELDVARAEAALLRAIARISVAEKAGLG